MDYYILIIDGKAHESIPAESPDFPGVPITARYAHDLLARCIRHDGPVPCGWLYDVESGTFSAPEEKEDT